MLFLLLLDETSTYEQFAHLYVVDSSDDAEECYTQYIKHNVCVWL